MDKVVHFEIPADNVERAMKFYKENFNWNLNPIPSMNYTILTTGPTTEKRMPAEVGFINGGMLKRQSPIEHPIITIQVNSINESIKKIKKAGGKILGEKTTVGDMGFSAYFKDTEGNVLGIWENAKKK